MSNLLRAGNMAQTQVTYTGIPIQTSALGVCIPLVYGVCRVSCNLIWYGAFTQGSSNNKSGGITGKGSGNTGYTASVALGLCEGPIDSLGTIWVNSGTTGISGFGSLFTGAQGQSAWGYLTTFAPGQAIGYTLIAYVGVQNMDLGSSAQLPQMSFEVRGLLCNSVTPISDADPSQVVTDILTSAFHGASFPSAKLANLTAAGPQGAACYQNYTMAQGLLLSVAYTSQQSASSIIDDIAKATNSAPVWNGGVLTLIPYGDATVSGNTKTYVPSLSPVFTLSNDDFVPDQGGAGNTPQQDPVAWARKPVSDLQNHIKLDFADVANGYNNNSIEVKNDNLIAKYGLRTKTASGSRLFRQASAAYRSAYLQLQRESVMDTCTFALDARYCVLDPMDIVALPDPAGNIVNVRITEITENDDDTLSFAAELLVPGMGTAVLNTFQAPGGFGGDTNAPPGSVNTPLIFEPPSSLIGSNTQPEIWFGLSGSNSNWGGAHVWVSVDGGSSYFDTSVTVTGECRQGFLSGSLASFSGANPDGTNTPQFDCAESFGVLENSTASAAATFTTLCVVDSELFSYQSSTLISGFKFQLSSLYRGLYGTNAAAHTNGAPFCRLDRLIGSWAYSTSYIGQVLHFKFLSFNTFGNATQSLAAATDYTFTPAGVALTAPGQVTTLTSGSGTFNVARTTSKLVIDMYGGGGGGQGTGGAGATNGANGTSSTFGALSAGAGAGGVGGGGGAGGTASGGTVNRSGATGGSGSGHNGGAGGASDNGGVGAGGTVGTPGGGPASGIGSGGGGGFFSTGTGGGGGGGGGHATLVITSPASTYAYSVGAGGGGGAAGTGGNVGGSGQAGVITVTAFRN